MDWCKECVREHVQKTPIAYLLSEKKPSFLQCFSQNNPISDVFYMFYQKKTTYSQVKRLQSYGCGATEPGRCCYYPFAKRAVPWRSWGAGNSWMKWWHLETLGETHGLGGFFFVGVKRSNFFGGRHVGWFVADVCMFAEEISPLDLNGLSISQLSGSLQSEVRRVPRFEIQFVHPRQRLNHGSEQHEWGTSSPRVGSFVPKMNSRLHVT